MEASIRIGLGVHACGINRTVKHRYYLHFKARTARHSLAFSMDVVDKRCQVWRDPFGSSKSTLANVVHSFFRP